MCLAIPGKILEISSDNPTSALVDVVGVRRKIDLGLLQDDMPVPGDWVLIHVGFAMSKISEQDASRPNEYAAGAGRSGRGGPGSPGLWSREFVRPPDEGVPGRDRHEIRR